MQRGDEQRGELRPRCAAVAGLDEDGGHAGGLRPRGDRVDVPAVGALELPDPHAVAAERGGRPGGVGHGGARDRGGLGEHRDAPRVGAPARRVAQGHRDRPRPGPGGHAHDPARRGALEARGQRAAGPAEGDAQPRLQAGAAQLQLAADAQRDGGAAGRGGRGHAARRGQHGRPRGRLRSGSRGDGERRRDEREGEHGDGGARHRRPRPRRGREVAHQAAPSSRATSAPPSITSGRPPPGWAVPPTRHSPRIPATRWPGRRSVPRRPCGAAP